MTNQTLKKARIYHNPQCSKSRGALEILQQHGYDIESRLYLQEPPTLEELNRLCDLLQCQPTDLIRDNEALFQQLGLDLKDQRDHQAWLQILQQNPSLLQRPIVVIVNRAIIARPSELVKQLF